MEPTSNGTLEVTPAEAYPGWKAPEQHTLPSGAVFLLRKPPIRKMITRGQIPNPLMDVINGVFVDRDDLELTAEAEAKGLTEEELLEQRQAEAETELETKPPAPPEIPELPAEVEDNMTVGMIYAFRDVVAWASIVAPVVEVAPPVDGPLTASGNLSYDALDEDDISYIIKFANGELASMATFPAEPERPAGGQDGADLRDASEPAAGDTV